MKREPQDVMIQSTDSARRRRARRFVLFIALTFLALPSNAHASIFQGETLDSVANAIAWVVLIITPIIGITAFWLVHILPEKIAHKKMHPQTKAIQCLCLLSLCFGGLLWPLAWLWAYTKPVLHKMAYGTDKAEPAGDEPARPPEKDELDELKRLYRRVAELETRMVAKKPAPRQEA